MIQIRARGTVPARLAANQAKWTRRYKTGSGRDWATKTAKGILLDALLPLTYGKCAFCEGRLRTQAYAQVEHYHPKTFYLELAFEWTNLFPACQVCNTSKGDQDHKGQLIKPDEEDPEEYLCINPVTGDVEPVAGLDAKQLGRAVETIRILKLNRCELSGARARLLCDVADWAWHRKLATSPDAEYKLVVRSMLRLWGLTAELEADRRRFHA
ncbi:MAG: TIGR02646 family protein [Acidobacteria bacterium]|nr:TIGR02646 family protein [Acidobacteriota bacterium]